MNKNDLKLAGTFSASQMPDALKDNTIDGYFYMVGHPTTNIKDAANSINVKIVPIENTILDSLVKKYPYYAKGNIPADTYKGQKEEIATFGVKAVLVTNENVSEKVVYSLVKAILENFDEFKNFILHIVILQKSHY